MPDIWLALANRKMHGVPIHENASCRLPDPIVIEPGRPYRVGLHLFDYTNCCPTGVDLYFTARTDRGEARSGRATLGYTIGSEIPRVQRYRRLVEPGAAERQKAQDLQ
jgi:hypothetical protein